MVSFIKFLTFSKTLRTHFQWKMYEMFCKEAKMIGDVLVHYTFRHRYAKTSHVNGTNLTNISAAMGLTTKVSHPGYSRLILSSTVSQYVHRNAKVEQK